MRGTSYLWITIIAMAAGMAGVAGVAGGCTCATVREGEDASAGSDGAGDPGPGPGGDSGGGDLTTDAAGGPGPADDAAKSPEEDSGGGGPTGGSDGAVSYPATDAGAPTTAGACGDPYGVPSGSTSTCGAGLTGGAAPPPTVTGTGWTSNCDTGAGYTMDVYEATSPGVPALRMIGVYEATWDRGFRCYPAGEATVDLSRPGASILVLSSYQPTHWTVTLTGGASLDRIILNGYYPQSVTAPSTIPVDNFSGDCGYLEACAYAWPSDTGGCDTPGLVAAVESLTGLTLASFHGCYAMSEVSLF